MKNSKHVLGIPGGRHIFGTVRVGEKGQIVIPKEARDLYGIHPGDTLLVLGDDRSGLIVTRPELMHDAAMRVFRDLEEKDNDPRKDKKDV